MLSGIQSFLMVQYTSRNIDCFIFSIDNELSEKNHTGCFTIPSDVCYVMPYQWRVWFFSNAEFIPVSEIGFD